MTSPGDRHPLRIGKRKDTPPPKRDTKTARTPDRQPTEEATDPFQREHDEFSERLEMLLRGPLPFGHPAGAVALALSELTAVKVAELWPTIDFFIRVPDEAASYPQLAAAAPALFEPGLLADLEQVAPGDRAELTSTVTSMVRAQLVTSISDQVSNALRTVTPMTYKNSWTLTDAQRKQKKPPPALREQILNPTGLPKKPSGLQNDFRPLWEDTLIAELRALDEGERLQVAEQVDASLVQRIAGQPIEVVRDEFSRLDAFVKKNIERGFEGYVACRQGLWSTFGSIEGINRYYKQLVSLQFLGHQVTVHPVLARRLEAAEALLEARSTPDGQTWADAAKASLRSAGGFSIRENRNAVTQLSDHSFGWAVDLNADTNPNTPRSVRKASPIRELTGLDLEAGPEYTTISKGGTAEALLGNITRMSAASSRYMAAFESDAAFVDAMANYLESHGLLRQPWMRDDLLPTLTPLAKSTDSKATKTLVAWLQFIWEQRDSPSPESRVDLDLLDPPVCDQPGLPGLDDAASDDPNAVCEPDRLPDGELKSLAAVLLQSYRAYRESRENRDTKASKVGASAKASVGSIAAQGFFDLAPVLVAALRGRDGGALEWLGVAKGTKDFMHFQLEKGDQPPRELVDPEGHEDAEVPVQPAVEDDPGHEEVVE